MEEIKLKKCPCCGGEAEMKETHYIDATTSSVKVLCKKCALQTKSFRESIDHCAKEEAAKVWNRRKSSEVCDKCGSDNIEKVRIFTEDRITEEFTRCAICGRIIDEK